MEEKLRVAAYCRVSTEKDDQVNSLQNQRQYFSALIDRHAGWTLHEVYFDEGLSGTTVKHRSGFHRMIADAECGAFSLVLTKEVSRFARNTVDTLSYTRRLRQLGVGVIFTVDNIDTRDNDGELRLSIMATLAQEESRKISERVKWGQKRSMEQGVVFGRDLLGYTVRDGHLFVNQEEAEVVRLIFHKYLDEGKGTHVIARELQEAGIPPKRARVWSNTVILRVLRNEKYVGDLCQKKTCTPDYLTHAKTRTREKTELVYLRAHHEPILDRATWDRAQAELARRSPCPARKQQYANRYWCSGKIVCGVCGRHFVSRTKKRKDGTIYRAWRCRAAAEHGACKSDGRGGTIGCSSASVYEKVLLACAASALDAVWADKRAWKQELLKELEQTAQTAQLPDPAGLYRQIDKLEAKKLRAVDLTLDGTLTQEELKRQKQLYDASLTRLRGQIRALEARRAAQPTAADCLRVWAEALEQMTDGTACTPLYREVVECILVEPGSFLTLRLAGVPFGIRLHYRVSGRMDTYRVEVDALFAAALPACANPIPT